MKIGSKVFGLAASIALLPGCVSYPLGVSKAEWEAMSPEKQAEYRQLQRLAENQKRQDAESDRRHIEQSVPR